MAHRERRRGRLLTTSLAALLVMALIPIAVSAAGDFDDVPPTNVFYSDISWMADAGVTKGCSATRFCPDDLVTREQMAAFMHRLAIGGAVDAGSLGGVAAADYVTHSEIGTGDADTLDGLDSTAFLRSTAKAADANKLDGLDSTAFLRSNAKAVDADKLDGKDSSAFLQKSAAPRATYDSVEDAPEGVPVIMSVTIDAPASGVLLVEGTVDVTSGGARDTLVCLLGNMGNALPGTSTFVSVDYLDSGSYDEGLCTTMAGYTVSAGTYVIDFVVGSTDTATALLFSGNMLAQWVPFDGTGAVPAASTELNTYDGSQAKPYDLDYEAVRP